MFKFKITVVQLTPTVLLDEADKKENPSGVYTYTASNKKEALNKFHNEVAISCLDDFEIKAVKVLN